MSHAQLLRLRERAAQLLRKYRVAVVLFFAGVLLLLLPGQTRKTEQPAQQASACTFDKDSIQQELETILSGIDGAGRVKLMLTLACGEQTIYQTDDRTVTSSAGTTSESETVFRQSGSAEKSPVVQSVVYPQYQGALVVCDGAEHAGVRLAVIQAVSSLTGLGSNKITVVKMKGQ